MAYGWISLHRKIQENDLWLDPEPFDRRSAWIDLILLANHEDKKVIFDGGVVEVKRGSKITSLRKLSKKWKWSTTKVKKFLELLKELDMIDYKSDTKKTVYTICNYNVYQNEDLDKRNTEITQKRHRNNTEVTQKKTNNNDNNINNDNKDIYRPKISDEIYQKIIYKWNTIKEINNIDYSVIEYNKKSIADLVDKYGEENLFKAIDKISESEWLRGLTDKSNWTITFKWFLNFDNFEKVLMDEYKTKVNQKPKPRPQKKGSRPEISSPPPKFSEESMNKLLEELENI